MIDVSQQIIIAILQGPHCPYLALPPWCPGHRNKAAGVRQSRNAVVTTRSSCLSLGYLVNPNDGGTPTELSYPTDCPISSTIPLKGRHKALEYHGTVKSGSFPAVINVDLNSLIFRKDRKSRGKSVVETCE